MRVCIFIHTRIHTDNGVKRQFAVSKLRETVCLWCVYVSRLNVQMWSNNGSCVYAELSQLHTQSQSHWNGSVETKPNKPSIIISALPQNCLLGNSFLYICLNFVWIYFFSREIKPISKESVPFKQRKCSNLKESLSVRLSNAVSVLRCIPLPVYWVSLFINFSFDSFAWQRLFRCWFLFWAWKMCYQVGKMMTGVIQHTRIRFAWVFKPIQYSLAE